MFTGIVETTGSVTQSRVTAGGRRLGVRVESGWNDLALGASVSVSGVCLTVAGTRDGILEFDVVAETLERTTLGGLTAGAAVNLERSLRVGDRLDGHFVQGHVEGVARVTEVLSSDREWVVWMCAPPALRPCIIPKGGIAVDGVSLTIAALRHDEFSVALIPTTLQRTTLAKLRRGAYVNIETDILVRAVMHRMAALELPVPLTIDSLREAGFP